MSNLGLKCNAQWLSQDRKSHATNHALQNFNVIFNKFITLSQYLNIMFAKFSCNISYMKIHVTTSPVMLNLNLNQFFSLQSILCLFLNINNLVDYLSNLSVSRFKITKTKDRTFY